MSNPVLERLREGGLYMVVLVSALIARIPAMNEGFWIDEVMTTRTIHGLPWDTQGARWDMMFTRIGFTDVHPPGYYALLKAWSGLVGTGDFALRLLSLFAGLATVGFLVFWIRRRAGRLAALFGGLALAWAPFHIHYSVEVRSYALFTLGALVLAWAVDRWVSTRSSRTLWVVVALELVTLSLHYYALLWVVLLNLYVFTHAGVCGRRERLVWFRGQLFALVAVAAWLPMILVQIFELPDVMKAHLSDDLPLARIVAALGPLPSLAPDWASICTGVGMLALALAGVWFTRSPPAPTDAPAPTTGSVLVLVLVLVAGIFAPFVPAALMPMSEDFAAAFFRQLPMTYAVLACVVVLGGVAALVDRVRLRLSLPVVLLIGGPVLVAVLHQVQPMLFLRNLLVFLPLVILLAAWALERTPRWGQIAACVLLCVLATPHEASGSESFMPRQNFRGVVDALTELPSGPVTVVPGWDSDGLRHYRRTSDVRMAMSVPEIVGDPAPGQRMFVLLSRPERFDVTADQVLAALGPAWRLRETRTYRGHRGPMQLHHYVRAGVR